MFYVWIVGWLARGGNARLTLSQYLLYVCLFLYFRWTNMTRCMGCVFECVLHELFISFHRQCI